MKRPPNILDDPELYESCRCAVCSKCWRHKITKRCIYNSRGPGTGLEGYEEKS